MLRPYAIRNPWCRGTIALLGVLYLVLTVNALTCLLRHDPALSGAGEMACANHPSSGDPAHHGLPAGAGGTSSLPSHGNHHQSLCNCLNKLASASSPEPPDAGTALYATRVALPVPVNRPISATPDGVPSPRGPPAVFSS